MRARKTPQTAGQTMDAWRNVAAIGLRATLLATALTAAFAGSVRADDIQAKLGYCKDCHGPSAQG
ncbi:MAG: hypothetical protein WBD95_13800, partial [Xanthobacteraceae bacterium]